MATSELANAQTIKERCTATNPKYRGYVRCTLEKDHNGKHLGTNDAEWESL